MKFGQSAPLKRINIYLIIFFNFSYIKLQRNLMAGLIKSKGQVRKKLTFHLSLGFLFFLRNVKLLGKKRNLMAMIFNVI